MAKSGNNIISKRIGILGGTFNPIHNGHIKIALLAKKKLKLDSVYFVPAYIPPHKKVEGHASPKDRLLLVKLAIKPYKGFLVSDYEIRRKRLTYSFVTLSYFRRKFGHSTELFFIIGGDSLLEIGTWKRPKELFKLAKFVAINRPGFMFKTDRRVIMLKMKGIDISSTRVRRDLKSNKNPGTCIPAPVKRYIMLKEMYRY